MILHSGTLAFLTCCRNDNKQRRQQRERLQAMIQSAKTITTPSIMTLTMATTALMASLLVLPSATLAFVCPATTNNAAVTLATPTRSFQTTTMAMSLLDQEESTNADTSPTVSRRSFWQQAAFLTAVVATATPPVALAKAPAVSQEDADKAKLKKGYDRLTFLLDNWEKETTVCKTGTDSPFTGCDRTPIKVMEYLGYKDMNDPLFKADKTMRRLEDLVPAGMESKYQDAMELWAEKADEGSGMAYVSSWGEANPGGGKDRVIAFLERSKNDVIACRNALGTVIQILDI